MNDGSRLEQQLRSTLQASADDIDVALHDVGTFAARGRTRRRRRHALIAAAAATLVVVAGAVVLQRGDGDRVETVDEPPTPTTGPVVDDEDAGTDTDAAPDEAGTVTVPPPSVVVDDAAAPSSGGRVVDPATLDANAGVVLPWRDGFMLVATIRSSQPLPAELPEEISTLFSQEVLDVFAEGLPPTIAEATEMLDQAGLLDEVTAVLSEHPEAEEAIYSIPTPPVAYVAATTDDGAEWHQTELELPIQNAAFTTDGEALVAWAVEGDGTTAAPHRLSIAASDDLTTWRSTTIDLGTTDDRPPYVHGSIWVDDLTVLGDRWYAAVHRSEYLDVEAILPDDVRDEVLAAADGWRLDAGDDGIEIVYTDPSGEPVSHTFTWNELGFDGDPGVRFDGAPATTLLSGDFDGVTGEGTVPVDATTGWSGQLVALDGRLVYAAAGLFTSTDGLAWTPVDGIPAGVRFESVVPLDDGVFLVGYDEDAHQRAWTYRDGDGLVERELPELPGSYTPWNQGDSTAWIVQLDQLGSVPDPVIVTLTHDGYELALTERGDVLALTATDAATGEVVVDEVLGPDRRDDLFRFDDVLDEGYLLVTDPDTGDELVRVPTHVLDAAYAAAYEAIEPVEAPAGGDEWAPDLWVIARSDAGEWFVDDLVDPDPDPEAPPQIWPRYAAVNGDVVIYQTVDGWATATIG